MKLIQTKQVGSGKVFDLVPKSSFKAYLYENAMMKRAEHLRKLRAMK